MKFSFSSQTIANARKVLLVLIAITIVAIIADLQLSPPAGYSPTQVVYTKAMPSVVSASVSYPDFDANFPANNVKNIEPADSKLLNEDYMITALVGFLAIAFIIGFVYHAIDGWLENKNKLTKV